ncbi:unnamed protein product [Closterium sp. NIES-65]|nr:unnamed protein product [Closterium sp. NIES-65]
MTARERGNPLNAGVRVREASEVASEAATARILKNEISAGSGNENMGVGVGVDVGDGGGGGRAVDASVHVATQIKVSGVSVPVSFDALRCFSLPRAARKAAGDVQVWWHGLTGGGTGGGSKSGGGSRGKGGGAACKQLRFFANPACKGKALDEVLQPQFAALRRFFHVPRWVLAQRRLPDGLPSPASVVRALPPCLPASLPPCLLASLPCLVAFHALPDSPRRTLSYPCATHVALFSSHPMLPEITCQHATCMPTTDSKGVTCLCATHDSLIPCWLPSHCKNHLPARHVSSQLHVHAND